MKFPIDEFRPQPGDDNEDVMLRLAASMAVQAESLGGVSNRHPQFFTIESQTTPISNALATILGNPKVLSVSVTLETQGEAGAAITWTTQNGQSREFKEEGDSYNFGSAIAFTDLGTLDMAATASVGDNVLYVSYVELD